MLTRRTRLFFHCYRLTRSGLNYCTTPEFYGSLTKLSISLEWCKTLGDVLSVIESIHTGTIHHLLEWKEDHYEIKDQYTLNNLMRFSGKSLTSRVGCRSKWCRAARSFSQTCWIRVTWVKAFRRSSIRAWRYFLKSFKRQRDSLWQGRY